MGHERDEQGEGQGQGLLDAWDLNMQRKAMLKIGELFSNLDDPRVSDWQYAALAEDQMERDGSGDDWALSEMADGRTDAECAENVTSE